MAKPLAAVISIVDDDSSVGEATGSLLRANGFTVATFLSAAQFLASPERTGPSS
jgi:FixJ family two-component response regulator